MPVLLAVPVTKGFYFVVFGHRHSSPCPIPSWTCYFFRVLSISVRRCLDTALILSLQLSPDPHELMLPEWGTERKKCDPLFCGVFCAAAATERFPWKKPEKYGVEGPRERSTRMSPVQVKSKPASVALQAPPWNSLFRLFSCVATRSVHRTKGEWAYQR